MPTIDLSAAADETAGQAAGRRIGGAVLMVVCGALTLGILAVWLLGPWLSEAPEWIWEFGDVFPFLAVITFILSAVGFELLRRDRKRKGEVGPQASALMAAVEIVERLDGGPEPPTTMSAGEPAARPAPPGAAAVGPLGTETHL